MKRTIIALILSTVLVLSTASAVFATPIDIQYHWSGTAVNTLIENNILSGYPNGRFRPDKNITREEAASILKKYMTSVGYVDNGEQPSQFSDVPSSRWSFQAIQMLASNGIMNGYGDGRFQPMKNLSREELAAVADRCITFMEATNNSVENDTKNTLPGYVTNEAITPTNGGVVTTEALQVTDSELSGDERKNTYNDESQFETAGKEGEDVDPDDANAAAEILAAPFSDIRNSFALESINRLYDRGIISGYSDGTFKPTATITRSETASIIYKMSGLSGIKPQITLPQQRVIWVPYISQVYPVYAPVGCEATSLLMGLKGKGYAENVGLRSFLDAMPKHPSNPAKGFVGSPYKADPTKKTRTTIYPAKLAEFGRWYGKVTDISGYSPHELKSEILAGNPVVAYQTLWWETPFYRYYNIEGTTQRLLSNNHVVMVNGYDRATNRYYISDPYNKNNPKSEYRYWISGSTFDRLYEVRRHAVVVE